MEAKSSDFVVLCAFAANLLIAVSKFTAAFFTGSSAILSEGIHSLVDTSDQLLLLWGRKRSDRPPDENHPFGHGLEIYFWTLVVALLLFAFGGGMSIYEGITHILRPEPVENVAWNYGVLGVAFLAEGVSFAAAFRELRSDRRRRTLWQAFHRSKNPSVFVVAAEDSAALLGLLVAFLGIFLGHRLGMPVLDGAASILIGLLLASVAALLAYESRALLLGESIDAESVRRIKAIVESDTAVLGVGPPLTMHFGPDEVLLNMEIKFRPGLGTQAAVRAIEGVETRIRREFPRIKRIFIEAGCLVGPPGLGGGAEETGNGES